MFTPVPSRKTTLNETSSYAFVYAIGEEESENLVLTGTKKADSKFNNAGQVVLPGGTVSREDKHAFAGMKSTGHIYQLANVSNA